MLFPVFNSTMLGLSSTLPKGDPFNKRTMMVLYRSPEYQAAQVYGKKTLEDLSSNYNKFEIVVCKLFQFGSV